MNIFKILANGHGTVNENNISAFLGYLLDPNENHSLDYEFLFRFLSDVINEDDNYEYKIFFEQEFREERKNKKEVVDIVIVCYHTNNSKLKKSSVKDFIQNKKEIKKIILIENKINSGAKNIGQLKRQYKSTIDELKKIEKSINSKDTHSIYVTPDNDGFSKEFENFKNEINSNATHIVWKQKNENEISEKTSIKEILENLLSLEIQAKIDPINDYTKHTLKSFIQFIETDFKSEKEIKKDGERNIYKSIDNYYLKNSLNKQKSEILEKLTLYFKELSNENITYQHSKTHPISLIYKKRKIFGLKKGIKDSFLFQVLLRHPSIKEKSLEIKEYCINHNLEPVEFIENDVLNFYFNDNNINKIKELITKITK